MLDAGSNSRTLNTSNNFFSNQIIRLRNILSSLMMSYYREDFALRQTATATTTYYLKDLAFQVV